MEIKYNSENKLVLSVDELELEFKEDNEKIVKLLTDPSVTLNGELIVSNKIDSEPDITFASNYKKLISEFLLAKLVYKE